jgi:hypothetical protein
MVVMGFLTKLPHSYALSPDAATFLDRRSPMCIAGIHDFLAAPEFVALVFQDPAGAVRRGGDHAWRRYRQMMPEFESFKSSTYPPLPMGSGRSGDKIRN